MLCSHSIFSSIFLFAFYFSEEKVSEVSVFVVVRQKATELYHYFLLQSFYYCLITDTIILSASLVSEVVGLFRDCLTDSLVDSVDGFSCGPLLGGMSSNPGPCNSYLAHPLARSLCGS